MHGFIINLIFLFTFSTQCDDLNRCRIGEMMGASLSSLTECTNCGSTIGPGLGDIPDSCVACVFLYLTPPEICNLALLNRAFRGAASSDSVWEAKLPHDYRDLLDLLPFEETKYLSKKNIFALLSRPMPFDDCNKVPCCGVFAADLVVRCRRNSRIPFSG